MSTEKLKISFKNLKKAVERFDEILKEPVTQIVKDAALQRFEFTYELMWKTLKIYLEDIHGLRAVSPRQVFKEAYSLSIIENEDIFLEMIQSRNLLAHTYNEDQADNIFAKLSKYLPVIQNVLNNLKF